MKTFDRKNVISWSNSEDAKKYIEQSGYFGNSFQELVTNVNNNATSILWNVFRADEVHCVFKDVHDIRYGLFLPADKVKKTEKEKKWRAFRTFDELKENGLILGLHLAYRRKDNREQRNIGIITCFQLVDNKLTISIGPNTFSLNQLFNEYELYDELEWKPFGIEESSLKIEREKKDAIQI